MKLVKGMENREELKIFDMVNHNFKGSHIKQILTEKYDWKIGIMLGKRQISTTVFELERESTIDVIKYESYYTVLFDFSQKVMYFNPEIIKMR